MASYQIPALERFDFIRPEEWPRWIRRFERFRQASDLTAKLQESQVSTLIYAMGNKGDNILQSFNLLEDDAKIYKTVKDKFESLCETPKYNIQASEIQPMQTERE